MVSDQIIKVLDNLCEKFGLAIDWSSKNIQPYLEELMAKAVNYKFSIATMIFSNIITIITCRTFPEKIIVDMIQTYLK